MDWPAEHDRLLAEAAGLGKACLEANREIGLMSSVRARLGERLALVNGQILTARLVTALRRHQAAGSPEAAALPQVPGEGQAEPPGASGARSDTVGEGTGPGHRHRAAAEQLMARFASGQAP